MTEFSTFGLADPLLRAVGAEGYSTATPIQSQLIPVLMQGHDAVGIAQTGTGKTAAFALPVLQALVESGWRPAPKTVGCLILSPTRELALQIADTFRSLGRRVRPSIAVIVGGVRPGPQIKDLARGVDIVVATPGRLDDHLRSGAVTLADTGMVVLDEADQMMDLGFLPTVRRIMEAAPKDRQTVLMSATMPKEIRRLAQAFLRDPVEVSVAPASRPIEKISQSVRHVPGPKKRAELIDILADLERDSQTIIFTRTKRGADRVCAHLLDYGHKAAAIHGNKTQSQRERSLASFRNGRVQVLVATDIAARGIDVPGVSLVINYELPNVPEAYVHRIGRTARAGREGMAISLCDPSERDYLRDIEKLIRRKIDGVEASPSNASAEPVEALIAEPHADTQKPRATEKTPGGAPNKRRTRPRSRPNNKSGGKPAGKPGSGFRGNGGKQHRGKGRPPARETRSA